MQALFPLVLVAMFLVLVVLPQRRRMRAQQATLSALGRGHRVMLTSGVYGVIIDSNGDVLAVSVAPGVVLHVARRAVMRRVWEDDNDAPTYAALGAADVEPAEERGEPGNGAFGTGTSGTGGAGDGADNEGEGRP